VDSIEKTTVETPKKIASAPTPLAIKAPVAASPWRGAPAVPPPVHAPYLPAHAVAAALAPTPVLPPKANRAGVWGTMRGMFFGMIVGWIVRWVVAGVLYLGRFFHDIGTPGSSSGLWIEETSVIVGLLASGLTLFVHLFKVTSETASSLGLSPSALRARAPWVFMKFALLLWGIFTVFLLANHSQEWRHVGAMNEHHVAMIAEAKRLENSNGLISLSGKNALDLYVAILRENPSQSEATLGRDRILQQMLANARQLYSERRLADAEQVYQLLLAKGCNAGWVNNERATLYQIHKLYAFLNWSAPIEIGNNYIEIVSDGPFEVGAGNGDRSIPVTGSGTQDFMVDVPTIRFRSREGQRSITLYLANLPDPRAPESANQLQNPLSNLYGKTRRAGGKVTIGNGSPRLATPPQVSTNRPSLQQNSNAPPAPIRSSPYSSANVAPQDRFGTRLASYRALISNKDKRNSTGRDLTQVPDIKLQDFLQQDRFNYYHGLNRDRDDQGDAVGSQQGYKALRPLFLNPLTPDTSPDCLQAVFYGEPLLEITLYQNATGVRLIHR